VENLWAKKVKKVTMKSASHKGTFQGQGWIIFFYSVPSKPVSSRMKVWRKLIKTGAVQLKGSVYILPFNDDHYEFLQWLVSEIAGMKGEADFVKIEKVDTMSDPKIIALFNRQRASDYKVIEKALGDIERKLSSTQKGGKSQNLPGISEQIAKLRKDFEEVKKIDFFSSDEGKSLAVKIKQAEAEIRRLSVTGAKKIGPAAIIPQSPDDYQGKTWTTRKRPFIDRMASAWLIRKFIDRDATFVFLDEKDMETAGKNSVAFDVRGGEFTHTGDLCTFEVLIKSFGLKDKVLKKIAEIVHDLDLKDGKYGPAEAKGLEDILIGIRITAKDDADALERGMAVFEMLYVSKS
jgi:hypothetical protein